MTLPVGRYWTALEVIEGILQCMTNPENPWYFKITVHEELNIAVTSQGIWMMATSSVAQALGGITREDKIRLSRAMGLKINPSLTPN